MVTHCTLSLMSLELQNGASLVMLLFQVRAPHRPHPPEFAGAVVVVVRVHQRRLMWAAVAAVVYCAVESRAEEGYACGGNCLHYYKLCGV